MDEQPTPQPPSGETPAEQGLALPGESTTRVEEAERPPSTPRAAPRRLTRRADRRVLGGVASGLADYFGLDPVISRLGFVAFGFVTGPLAILLYAIAWVVVPGRDDHGGRGGGPASWGQVWVWAFLGVAALLLIPAFSGLSLLLSDGGGSGFGRGPGLWHPGLFWALILIGVGVLLFRRGETADSGAVEGRGAPAALESGAAPVGRAPRRSSILGRLIIAAALLLLGVSALLQNLGVRGIGDHIFELFLLLTGVGLIVGAWWGRARWLIVVGAFLLAGLVAVDALPVRDFERFWSNGFGYQSVRPVSRAAVAEPFDLGAGEMRLDLTALPLTPDPTRVDASVGMGKIEVIVPRDSDVTVDAAARAGNVELFGEEREGSALEVQIERMAGPADQRLALDLEAGFGEITVREARPGERFRDDRFRDDGSPFSGDRFRDDLFPLEDDARARA